MKKEQFSRRKNMSRVNPVMEVIHRIITGGFILEGV
jgi:hypothetical protein